MNIYSPKHNHKDNFIYPVLNAGSVDIYIIRKSILAAINSSKSQFSGVLLDVGCGGMPYKGFLESQGKVDEYYGMDLISENYSPPDIYWDGKNIPLNNNSVDCVIATEVLEHCSDPERVMNEIFRVLKPKGFLFFTVPFVWPLHDVPNDQYRYTPFSLERHLKNSGFEKIEIKSMGGWDASLAQMIGLWVNRRRLPPIKKKILQYLSIFIIKILLKKDTIPNDYSGLMSIGFSGIAKK